MLRIDSTYPAVRFSFKTPNGEEREVRTLEKEGYPHAYHRLVMSEGDAPIEQGSGEVKYMTPVEPVLLAPTQISTRSTTPAVKEQHLVLQENQKGVSFDRLFGPYLEGATKITVTDLHLREF